MSAAKWVTMRRSKCHADNALLVVHEQSDGRFYWEVDLYSRFSGHCGYATTMRGAKAAAERAARGLAKAVK